LRLKEQDGDDDKHKFDNNNNKSDFYKEKTIHYLIDIFNFVFLSDLIGYNDDEEIDEKEDRKNEDNEENEDNE